MSGGMFQLFEIRRISCRLRVLRGKFRIRIQIRTLGFAQLSMKLKAAYLANRRGRVMFRTSKKAITILLRKHELCVEQGFRFRAAPLYPRSLAMGDDPTLPTGDKQKGHDDAR